MSTVLILSLLSFFQYKVEIDAKIIRVSGRKVQLEKFCSQEAKNFAEPWMDLRPEWGFFGQIWAILLGFGPFCLDLGHIAWIWAIWQNLGQNRPQRRQRPEDGSGKGMNERKSPVLYRTLCPLGPLPKNALPEHKSALPGLKSP